MKILFNTIFYFIVFLLLFLFLLLINSANFLLNEYMDLDFSVVLYQLSTPLQGTSHDLLNTYITEYLLVAIVEFLVIFVLVRFISKKLFQRIHYVVACKIGKKQFRLQISKKHSKRIAAILLLFIFIGLSGLLYQKVIAVGIPKYISDISQDTTLFEDYYVSPNDVELSFPDNKKNLLFIYAESMEVTYAGALGQNLIPNLTALADENISFSDRGKDGGLTWYGSTSQTISAIISASCGLPLKVPIGTFYTGDYEALLPGAVGIGEVLNSNGYDNYFMCGSDSTFGGRKLWFSQHGNYNILDYAMAIEEGIIPEDYYEFWGMEDKYLFEYAKEKLTEISNHDKPFNFTMLTVDTHMPDGYVCDLCETDKNTDLLATISCSDRQITAFVDWCKEQPWYEDTVIVIIGDHPHMTEEYFSTLPEGYPRRTYNCIINSSVSPTLDTQSRLASNMDLFPTTLAAMGITVEGERLGIGTNLFSNRPTVTEELGLETFTGELSKHSTYYDINFIYNR